MQDETVVINRESMLPVGTLLRGGKFRIERHLSSGGFGNTYVATNTEFEEQVAIKEFFMRGISERDSDSVSVSVSNKTNLEQFTSQKEKFRKEARRLHKLRNPHIVAVHDLFEENGTAYYEMDLIKGESLSERMKRMGQPLGEAEVLRILDQVLDALSVVHAQGLYHLDLKPGNIMVDQSGRALLIDFGASKQMSAGDGYSVSTSSALAFTPGYAPLEQTEQNMKAFGPWTDLYALGATLYKLLTGLTPPSASELLVSREPLVFSAPVSLRMQQLIAWMMKPAFIERPQSVNAVRAFLKETMRNEVKVSVSNVHPIATDNRRPQNRTWIAIIAVIVGICFVVSFVVGVLFFNAVSDNAEQPVVVIPTDTATVVPVAPPSKLEKPTKPQPQQATTSKPTRKPSSTNVATPVKPNNSPSTSTTTPLKPSQPVKPNNSSNNEPSPLDNLEF